MINTVMHSLMTGMHSEKCFFRRFCHCVNITECTYINLGGIAYGTLRLYGLAARGVQPVAP